MLITFELPTRLPLPTNFPNHKPETLKLYTGSLKKTRKFRIAQRNQQLWRILDFGYKSIPRNIEIQFDIGKRNTHMHPHR